MRPTFDPWPEADKRLVDRNDQGRARPALDSMVAVLDELSNLVDHFAGAAGVDPLSAALLLVGALLVGVAVAVAAWLGAGAVVAAARDVVR